MPIVVPVNPTVAEPPLVSRMREPSFYPHAPATVELRTTNTSWVFLAGRLVYKVKRPVRFPFLDYSTLERRLEMCREELALNRELAPDTYLCVRSIVSADGQLELGSERDSRAVEYAVEMRCLPEARSMARLATAGSLREADVDAVAMRVAGFHAAAAAAPASDRHLDPLIESVEQVLAALREAGAGVLDPTRLRAAESFAAAFLARRRDYLLTRVEQGLVRHCHGDLRAEHVILGRQIVIFDRLEFDPQKRWIDVASEVAFLVMDLEALGAGWASRRFVDAYRDAGGDPGDEELIAFFASFRTWIRALVACLRSATPAEDRAAQRQARELLALGDRFAWRTRLPLVLAVAGTAATGKTTLARELASVSGLPNLSSDETRKRLAGLAPTRRAGPEHYGDAFSRRTYRELGALAASAIRESGGVIVDATFRRPADRDAFREGLGQLGPQAHEPVDQPRISPPIVFVECSAPRSVLLRRVRAGRHGEVSDADEPVVERQLAEYQPLPGATGALLTVRTDRPTAEVCLEVEGFLDSRPPAMTSS